MTEQATTQQDQVVSPAEDAQSTKEVMRIVKLWVETEAKNTAFLVKAHPKGQQAMNVLADKFIGMFQNFIEGKGLPEIEEFDPKQLELANSGFWVNRSKRVQREADQG